MDCNKMRIVVAFLISFICLCLCEDLDEGCVSLETARTQIVRPKVIQVYQSGHLYSPGFDRNGTYPNSVQCSYQLQAPRGMHIRIQFNQVDIYATDGCEADALSIHDFSPEGQGVLQFMLCGKLTPHDFVSQSHALQLVLRTDDFAARRGFNVTYSVQDSADVCSVGWKQCRNRNCVKYTQLCDGKDDCDDGTDEENCSLVSVEPPECGQPEITPLPWHNYDRIVGGKAALAGSWPWMADLQMKAIEPNGHLCGGVLISAQWVLTAAHCFQEPMMRNPSGWRVHLGNYKKFERDDHEQIRFVDRIVIHEDIPSIIFEKNGEFDMTHDMALIKLNAPVSFSKYVKPICLPDLNTKLSIVSNCFAIGWGATRGTGSSDVLKQAYHPVQPDILCSRRVGKEFNPETMICAGSMAPLNGVCHGDSGGPLVCEIKKSWQVVGVASYVTDSTIMEGLCGLSGRPSVFSKVAVKTGWIQRIINRYS